MELSNVSGSSWIELIETEGILEIFCPRLATVPIRGGAVDGFRRSWCSGSGLSKLGQPVRGWPLRGNLQVLQWGARLELTVTLKEGDCVQEAESMGSRLGSRKRLV